MSQTSEAGIVRRNREEEPGSSFLDSASHTPHQLNSDTAFPVGVLVSYEYEVGLEHIILTQRTKRGRSGLEP
jgi:hypothetical protein